MPVVVSTANPPASTSVEMEMENLRSELSVVRSQVSSLTAPQSSIDLGAVFDVILLIGIVIITIFFLVPQINKRGKDEGSSQVAKIVTLVAAIIGGIVVPLGALFVSLYPIISPTSVICLFAPGTTGCKPGSESTPATPAVIKETATLEPTSASDGIATPVPNLYPTPTITPLPSDTSISPVSTSTPP